MHDQIKKFKIFLCIFTTFFSDFLYKRHHISVTVTYFSKKLTDLNSKNPNFEENAKTEKIILNSAQVKNLQLQKHIYGDNSLKNKNKKL